MPPPMFQTLTGPVVSTFSKDGAQVVHRMVEEDIAQSFDENNFDLGKKGINALEEIVWRVASGDVDAKEMASSVVTCALLAATKATGQSIERGKIKKRRREEDLPEEEKGRAAAKSLVTWFVSAIWQATTELVVSLKPLEAALKAALAAAGDDDSKKAEIADGPLQQEIRPLNEQFQCVANFVHFLCHPRSGLPLFEQLAKEQLGLRLLEGAKMIDEKQVRKLLVKKRTSRLWLQTKFNLLAEESEGFAKVMSELHGAEEAGSMSGQVLSHRIKSLIGFFHLDPNRTCSVVLEALRTRMVGAEVLEQIPSGLKPLVEVLSIFRKRSVNHLLGKQFHDSIVDMPLCRVAALLIAARVIDPSELMPHLGPSNADMREQRIHHSVRLLENAANIGVVKLLASREEREADANKRFEEELKAKAEDASYSSSNQKFGVLCGLYDLRAWQASKTFGKLLVDMGADPMVDSRVVNHLCGFGDAVIEPLYNILPSKVCPSKLGLVPFGKATKTGRSETLGGDDGANRDLYDCYSSADSLANAASMVGPIVNRLGENVGSNVFFFTKICRVLNHAIQAENILEDGTQKKWVFAMLERCLIPAMSVAKENIGMGAVLWELLRHVEYNKRYKMYAEWKVNLYSKRQSLVIARAETQDRTRTVMRRLAKENAKVQGMRLAKVAHSNPLIVFNTILDQVEIYDNLIGPVVEALKHLSPLSFDILAFCVVDKLSASRRKLKSDGTNVSSWLHSLSVFTGTFFRRYPFVEHRGVLQYVTNILEEKESVDLVILKELVTSMSGIVVLEDLSAVQLQGRAGGQTLTFVTNQAKEMEGSIDKSRRYLSQNLMCPPLHGTDKPLALTLLILMAQQLSNIVYSTESKALKLVSNLYDRCNITMAQLIEFLALKFYGKSDGPRSDTVYLEMLPSLEDLLGAYSLDPAVAFALAQPAFRMLREWDVEATDLKKHANTKRLETVLSKWESKVLLPVVEQYIDSAVWEHISPDLYLTFWSHSIFDIHCPSERYEKEITKLAQEIAKLKAAQATSSSRSKIKRKADIVKQLRQEQAYQEKHVKSVLGKLRGKREKWTMGSGSGEKTVEMFLQHCIVPRAVQSPEDAYFCAQFVRILHDTSSPQWPSMRYFDLVERCIPVMVYCSTEREGLSLGMFLSETQNAITSWSSKEKFQKECFGKFRADYTDPTGDPCTYENFEKLRSKWTKKNGKVFKAAMASGEYMTIRNTLNVLTRIKDVYPNDKDTMQSIEAAVNQLIESEERKDIKTVAQQYANILKKKKRQDPSLDPNPPPPKAPKVQINFDDKPAAPPAAPVQTNKMRDSERNGLNANAVAWRPNERANPPRPPPSANAPVPKNKPPPPPPGKGRVQASKATTGGRNQSGRDRNGREGDRRGHNRGGKRNNPPTNSRAEALRDDGRRRDSPRDQSRRREVVNGDDGNHKRFDDSPEPPTRRTNGGHKRFSDTPEPPPRRTNGGHKRFDDSPEPPSRRTSGRGGRGGEPNARNKRKRSPSRSRSRGRGNTRNRDRDRDRDTRPRDNGRDRDRRGNSPGRRPNDSGRDRRGNSPGRRPNDSGRRGGVRGGDRPPPPPLPGNRSKAGPPPAPAPKRARVAGESKPFDDKTSGGSFHVGDRDKSSRGGRRRGNGGGGRRGGGRRRR